MGTGSRVVPPVAIGLPVFDGERYLAAAIESVLAQTYTDFELIISDNASTDGTREICHDFAAKDERIRYFRARTNRGGAWNFGIVAELASSPLFKYQAHDDLCEPTFLERCIEASREEPDAVLWFPRAIEIDDESRPQGAFEDSLELPQATPAERIAAFFLQHRTANALFGLHRRPALTSARRMGRFHSADTVLLAELAMQGRFIEVPEPLFLRRVHAAMSHAGRSDAEVERWWDPGTRRNVSLRRSKMFANLLAGAARAPIPPPDRLNVQREIVRYWVPRYWRHMLGELRLASVRKVRVWR